MLPAIAGGSMWKNPQLRLFSFRKGDRIKERRQAMKPSNVPFYLVALQKK